MTNKKRAGARLPKNEILRGRLAFEKLFRHGLFGSGKLFDFVRLSSDSRGRVAFAASRKIRSSVKRNFVKRRLREAFRLERPEIAERANVIFIGREKILQSTLAAVRTEMRRLPSNEKVKPA